jgi:outer membrane receptor protein involved in Fe transport
MTKKVLAQSTFAGIASACCSVVVAQQAPAEGAVKLEEIVVTAAKTGENIQDVAGSVSALTGAQLEQIGAQSNEDYLGRAPGVIFNSQQPGFSTITIRGVNTSTSYANLSQGTTGSYINEIPLTDPFFSTGTPDIDTFDVDHVEIDRGPQGTLFGSASLGGAVNYVAKSANLSTLEAAAQTLQGGTEHGGYYWAYKGMLNLPIVDGTLGVRLVGIDREDSGFIDNVSTGREDANQTRTRGGRLMAAWQPADNTRLSWLTLYQKITTEDAPWQNPDLGALLKNTGVAEPSESTVLIHNLRLEQNLGWGSLVAMASYHRKTGATTTDIQRFDVFGFDLPAIEDSERASGETFELRLASIPNQPFTWLIGAMYDKTDVSILETESAANAAAVADALLGPGNGATTGNLWGVTTSSFTGKEKAIFGEARYAFANGIKITLGGRGFQTQTLSDTTGFGLLYAAFVNGSLNSTPPPISQSNSGFSPKASIAYSFNPSSQVYVLASKGFRYGGSNVNPDPSLPPTFRSDSLWNYELGFKGELFERRLTLDASVFKIDWSNIPLSVTTATGTTGMVNAGDASIKGAEGSLGWRITSNLDLDSSLTYLDGVLDSVAAGPGLAFGVAADSRLPGDSRWLASNILRYHWTTSGAPFVLLAHRFASQASALLQQFRPPGRNATLGNYHLFDARAGRSFGPVLCELFVNNLTDRRAILSAQYLNPPLANEIQQYVAQPRTFGLSVSWRL